MNIFAYSPDAKECALWLDDRRHNKMILETAQLLSTTCRFISDDRDPPVYKSSHVTHPCTIWARKSRSNMLWLIEYMQVLVDTKFGDHKSAELLPTFREFAEHKNWAVFTDEQTPFANCARNSSLGLDFTHLPVHEAYREYHRVRWALDDVPPTWSWGREPNWR